MRPLFVIDLETTDLDPNKGNIIEVGIARIDLLGRKVYPEYSKIVRQYLSDEEKNAWVFSHSTLTARDVERSPWSQTDVNIDLLYYQRIGAFTSFNQPFDLEWLAMKMGLHFVIVPDIMDVCTELMDGKRTSAQGCYYRFCQENPANLKDSKEEHRALSDAVMESYILLSCLKENPSLRTDLIDLLTRD